MPLRFKYTSHRTLIALGGIVGALTLALIPQEILAQSNPTFTPLTSIPYVDYTNITSFVNGFMRLLFVIASLLAVGMIIWGGFLYLTTESTSSKGEAKAKISDALIGLALLLVSVLLLTIINPDILNIRLFNSPSGVGLPLRGNQDIGPVTDLSGGVQGNVPPTPLDNRNTPPGAVTTRLEMRTLCNGVLDRTCQLNWAQELARFRNECTTTGPSGQPGRLIMQGLMVATCTR